MDKTTLKAEARKVYGRKVKKLRSEGLIPANIFGKKIKSEAIKVSLKGFQNVYKDVGTTGIVELQVGASKKPALVHDVQLNPKTDDILHVDFHQVDLKERIEAEVPVGLTGESPAEKQTLGTVVQYVNEVKVEALPTNLPESFTVDISGLTEVDQVVYVKDLKVDRNKVEIKNDPEEIVVKVEPPQKEEAVEAPPPEEGEAAEGEAPVEGETATEERAAEGAAEEESKDQGS